MTTATRRKQAESDYPPMPGLFLRRPEMLANFFQALTHLSHISAALPLARHASPRTVVEST